MEGKKLAIRLSAQRVIDFVVSEDQDTEGSHSNWVSKPSSGFI